MNGNKRNILIEKAAERACRMLKEQIEDIRYVRDWAERAGCSKRKLQKVEFVKLKYGLNIIMT